MIAFRYPYPCTSFSVDKRAIFLDFDCDYIAFVNMGCAYMPIKKELLEILCCPVSKQPVEVLAKDQLAEINELISQGKIHNAEGTTVDSQIEEALITTDGKTIYRIDDGIPVMLVDMGIPTEQVPGW